MKEPIAKFEKISKEEFAKYDHSGHSDIYYDDISIPQRATKGSAGYDIATPFNTVIPPGKSVIIPTGLRCKMSEEYVMLILPRSSMGIKHGMKLKNTCAVIDSDYYNADNEGHIMLAIENTGGYTLYIDKGERIAQAIFIPYGIAEKDEVSTERSGGIGSTGK